VGKIIWILAIFLVGSLGGCSNYRELNNISLVVGMGLDYLPDKDLYEITYQVINPAENAAKGTGSGASPVINFKTSGKTISEAATKHATVFSRENIYSHIQLMVIGENLAKKESLNFIFDIFERSAHVRVNVPILIARETDIKTAMDILSTIDKVPVRSLTGKVRNASEQLGEYGEVKIYNVIEGLANFGEEPAIPGISVIGDKKKGASKENLESMEKTYVTLRGVGLFNKGKLVGWMDGKETKSLQVIHNDIRQTNLRIDCDEKRNTSVMVNHLNSHSSVSLNNDRALITVMANASGYISEMLCNKDISKREVIKEFEEKAARQLEKEIKDGITAAQKLNSDVFGFGEILRRSDRRSWKKFKGDWNETFAQAEVDVQVKMEINGTGMLIMPYPY
jgi:spore germination protein KC